MKNLRVFFAMAFLIAGLGLGAPSVSILVNGAEAQDLPTPGGEKPGGGSGAEKAVGDRSDRADRSHGTNEESTGAAAKAAADAELKPAPPKPAPATRRRVTLPVMPRPKPAVPKTAVALGEAVPAGEKGANADKGPAPRVERSIYLPYEELENVFEKDGRGVFLPYREFLDLWNELQLQRDEDQVEPPADGVLSSASYTGIVEDEVLMIEAVLQVESFVDEGWAVIGIGGGGMSIADADTGEASLKLGDKGYEVLLPKKGKYEVRLRLHARVEKESGTHSTALQLPRAPVSKMVISVPEQGWDFELDAGVAFTAAPQGADRTMLSFFFGERDALHVTWRKEGEETKLSPLVFVDANFDARLTPGALQTRLNLGYRIMRAGVDRFELLVPEPHEVLNVTGDNIKEWTIAGAGKAPQVATAPRPDAVKPPQADAVKPPQADGAKAPGKGKAKPGGSSGQPKMQRLVVTLHEEAKERYGLEITLEAPIADLPAKVEAPLVTVQDVLRQSGSVTLSAADELEVEVAQLEGLTQQSFEGGAQTVDGGDIRLGTYRYLQTPFGLGLSVKRAEPVVEVTSLTQFTVEPDAANFAAQFNYNVKRVGIFETTVGLPTGFEGIDVKGSPVEDFREETIDGKPAVVVKFNGRQEGAVRFTITGRKIRDDASQNEVVPVFRPMDVARHDARAGVAVHTSLDPRTQNAGGMRQEEVMRVRGAFEQLQMDGTVTKHDAQAMPLTLAFRYRGEDAAATLAFKQKEPQVSGDVHLLVDVREQLIKYRWWVNYSILYAGVDTFILSVPEEIADDLRIDGKGIKETNKDYEPAADSGIEAEEGRKLWEVVFRDKQTGSAQFELSLEVPMANVESGESTDIAVPEMALRGVFNETGQIAVLKEGSLEILEATPENLEEIDPRELRGNLKKQGVVLAYKYRRHPLALTVEVSKNVFLPVPQAVVTYAQLNSVVSSDLGLTTEVVYWVRNNSKQFLSIRLPKKGAMASDIYVDGEPQQPMHRADSDEVLVRLPAGADQQEKTFIIRFVYSRPSPTPGEKLGRRGAFEIESAELVDTSILQTQLSLYLPDGYVYTDFEGPMSVPVKKRGWAKFRNVFDWLVPALGPSVPMAYDDEWSPPPGVSEDAKGGFDLPITLEGKRMDLHRLDAPAPVTVTFRSEKWSFTLEAILCFGAFLIGALMTGRSVKTRFVYFVVVGLGALVVAGAVAPLSADIWRAVYVGVFLAVPLWIVVGVLRFFGGIGRKAKSAVTGKKKAEKPVTPFPEVKKEDAPKVKEKDKEEEKAEAEAEGDDRTDGSDGTDKDRTDRTDGEGKE